MIVVNLHLRALQKLFSIQIYQSKYDKYLKDASNFSDDMSELNFKIEYTIVGDYAFCILTV